MSVLRRGEQEPKRCATRYLWVLPGEGRSTLSTLKRGVGTFVCCSLGREQKHGERGAQTWCLLREGDIYKLPLIHSVMDFV